MAFISLVDQKMVLNLQRSFLQFNQAQVGNQVRAAQAQIAAITKANSKNNDDGYDYTQTAEYQYWEQEDERLSTEQEAIAQQISVIDNEINSLNNLIKTGIQNSCKLTLSGG